MKVVTVNLRDIENRTHGSIGAGTSATVTMRYTGPVVLRSFGHIIPVTPKSKAVPSDGIVEFEVYTSDDPAVEPNYRGFAHRITVDVTDSRTGKQIGRWTSTVKVMEAHKEPVRAGLLPPAEGLPAKWVTVDDMLADVGASRAAAQSAQTAAQQAATDAQNALLTPGSLPENSQVVEGPELPTELAVIRAFIRERRPVLVAVDRAADALRAAGHTPHVVVIDSARDELPAAATLRSAQEVVVRVDRGDRRPVERLERLGLHCSPPVRNRDARSISSPSSTGGLRSGNSIRGSAMESRRAAL